MSDTRYDRQFRSAERDIRDKVGNTARAAEDINQQISEAAAEAGEALRDAARRVSAVAGDVGQRAYEQGNRYSKEMMDRVERQPLTSLAIAAGIGFVAGMLLTRR